MYHVEIKLSSILRTLVPTLVYLVPIGLASESLPCQVIGKETLTR